MIVKIVAIGTSKGIRIPKYLLDKYGFGDEIELDDTGSGIMLKPIRQARAGWDKAFANADQDNLHIDLPDSEWDEKEWHW